MKYEAKTENISAIIEEDMSAGFYLFIYDLSGKCIADHLQDSYESAQRQAEKLYGVSPSIWKEAPEAGEKE